MKKVLFLFVSSLLLCGCGIEQSAKSQMVKSIKKEALDPSSVKISDEEVVFKNDSICVIDFVLRQANREGGMDKSKMEYSFYHPNLFSQYHFTIINLKSYPLNFHDIHL